MSNPFAAAAKPNPFAAGGATGAKPNPFAATGGTAGAKPNPFAPSGGATGGTAATTAAKPNPFAPGGGTGGTANPFAAKPSAANPFAPGAATTPAGTAAAQAAAPTGPPKPVMTGKMQVSALPDDIRKVLVELNTLIHNHTVAMEAVVDKPRLDDRLTDLASYVSGLEYAHRSARNALLGVNRVGEGVINRHRHLWDQTAAVFTRATVAQTESGGAEVDIPCSVLRDAAAEELAHAAAVFDVLSQVEALVLPSDAAAVAHEAAHDASAFFRALRTNTAANGSAGSALAYANDASVLGGGDGDDDMGVGGGYGGRGGGMGGGGALVGGGGGESGTARRWGAFTSSHVDEADLLRLRDAARTYASTLSTQDLLKQVLMAQTAALVAVTGGAIAAVHDTVADMKRQLLRDLNVARGVGLDGAYSDGTGAHTSSEVLSILGGGRSLAPGSGRPVAGRRYMDPFAEEDGREESRRKKAADDRAVRMPKASTSAPFPSAVAAQRAAGEGWNMIGALQAAHATITGTPASGTAAGTNPFAPKTGTAATTTTAAGGAKPNPFAPGGGGAATTTAAATTATTTPAAGAKPNPFAPGGGTAATTAATTTTTAPATAATTTAATTPAAGSDAKPNPFAVKPAAGGTAAPASTPAAGAKPNPFAAASKPPTIAIPTSGGGGTAAPNPPSGGEAVGRARSGAVGQ